MLTVLYDAMAIGVMLMILWVLANVIAWNIEEWNGGDGE